MKILSNFQQILEFKKQRDAAIRKCNAYFIHLIVSFVQKPQGGPGYLPFTTECTVLLD